MSLAEDLTPRPYHRSSPWTVEKKDRLAHLWNSGTRIKMIVELINHEYGLHTRNSIIGAIHRLDLPLRRIKGQFNRPTATSKETVLARKARTLKPPAPVKEAQPSIDDLSIPIEQRKQLWELETGMCKWPVGDVGSPTFFFCGGKALDEKPYCSGHCQVAYRPRT